MMKSATLIGSVLLAGAVGGALFLRPKPTARETVHELLPEPTSIPPIVRQVVKSKMGRHEEQMRTLMSKVVLLDADAIARVAGEIYDEPTLARPVVGDELNGVLPERFFVLQDELKARAKGLVMATHEKNYAKVAEEFSGLAKSCVACHQVYLHESGAMPGRAPEARR
jgi:hypothetical protein